jgi:ABC-type cobalamin transport system ATPase subunit
VTINSIQQIIRGLSADGISILITDHRERETLAITDRSYIIGAGQVFCHGTAAEVLSNPEARRRYFGDGPHLELSGPAGGRSRTAGQREDVDVPIRSYRRDARS